MHGTLVREADGDALFFADGPDVAAAPALYQAPPPRSTYGADRRPNWGTIAVIALLHVAAFTALVKFDVIHIAPKKKILVVDLIAAPPVPPVEKPKPEPVIVEKVQPVVITPPQIVQTLAPPPPTIAVSAVPPPPKPVVAAPAPTAGPVMVGNLDERLLEGKPPRYPTESRRKKEQGTVIVRLLIGVDGHVAQISVAQSSGFERLDQAAIQAIRGWRWQPLVRDGQPVEVRGLYSLPFTLQA